MMDLKQVGRNYYNENEATEFLNRKYTVESFTFYRPDDRSIWESDSHLKQ